MERAGLNLSHRSQMAPSANEFMNDILSGDGEDSDAFMRGFKADVAAVSMNGTIGGDNVAKPQVARPNLRAVEDYRMPLPSKLDKIDEEAGGGAKGEKDVRARLAPDVAQSDTMAEKRAAEREVRRLVTERGDLMRTGMYGSGDKIISLIDERIEELTDRIAST
jgi:centrosomal protein CEP120